MPRIPIYRDTPVPVQGLTDSITAPAFEKLPPNTPANLPTGTVNTAEDEVTPEEAQTRKCTYYDGIYPVSVFVD